jgi:hypothetical protein
MMLQMRAAGTVSPWRRSSGEAVRASQGSSDQLGRCDRLRLLGERFSCQSRQLKAAGGVRMAWYRQPDASVLRARYRFASANSENTWAPFLAMPR